MEIKITFVIIVILTISMFSLPISSQTQSDIPPQNGTGFLHALEVIQGDIPETEQIEPENMVIIHDTMFFVIPWNETRIYINVPEEAQIGYILDVHNVFKNASFGPSQYPGWYYWEFGSGDERIMDNAVSHNNNTAFLSGTYDANIINITTNAISLIANNTYGEYTSVSMPVQDAVNILSATPVFKTNSDNTTFEVSNDDGTTWESAANGTTIEFNSTGTILRYRVILADDLVAEPELSDVQINFSYRPLSTTVALKTEYWIISDLDIPFFNFEVQSLYDISEFNVVIYHDPGYGISSSNVTWMGHDTVDPALLNDFQMTGKIVNIGTAEPGSLISLSVHPAVGELETPNYYLYSIVAVLIIIALTGIYLMRRGGKESGKEGEDDAVDDTEELDEAEGPGMMVKGDMTNTGQPDDLTLQKKNIIEALKKLDTDLEEGKISKDVYEELKSNYKAEAIRIMKELDS